MEKYYGEMAHYIDEFFLSEEKYRDHSYLSNIRISKEYIHVNFVFPIVCIIFDGYK
jgi:hypothetical protein